MAGKATSFVIELENENDNPSKPDESDDTKCLMVALRAKYCMENDDGYRFGYFGGKPPKKRTNSEGDAELAYLTNVCLSGSNIRRSGLEKESIKSLCPNVVDLDISGNFLDSWNEILPLIQQLKSLKFLNIARNMITKNKDVLHGWTDTLPNLENLVLNKTGVEWQEILHLAKLLPQLKELHICGNNYKEIPAGRHPVLQSLECLRMNDNAIVSWSEVWKLRLLQNLKSLILSGNPLMDIHYHDDDVGVDCYCSCHTASSLRENTVANRDHVDETASVSDSSQVSHVDVTKSIGHDNTVAVSDHVDDTASIANSSHDLDTASNLHDNKVAISECTDVTASVTCDNNVTISNNVVETFQVEVRQYCENILNSVIDEVIRNEIVKTEEMLVNGEEDNSTKQNVNDQNTVSGAGNQNQMNVDKVRSIETKPASTDRSEKDYIEQLSREIVEIILRRAHGFVKDGVDNESAPNRNTSPENAENPPPGKVNMAEDSLKADNSCCLCDGEPSGQQPFNSLETLCLSETHIGKWKHLSALRAFPSLKSVRIKNVKLGSKLDDEDRRKLFMASLPNIKLLNGSEVTPSDREKSERFLLRHFSEKKLKPDVYHVLEQKHGKLAPLVDIDISKGLMDYVNLSFVYRGEVVFTDMVCVREKFGTLRKLIATKVKKSLEQSVLFHKHCNSRHEETVGELQEIRGDGLPMSRLDIFDGDEIHIDEQTLEKWRLDPRHFNRQTGYQ
ncbi:tubulin-specific chaperone cofactor E-like protein isoform X2 [Mercenaria mercenaria]|uniref:tubulin-specific chaperone cofactor E-like protein isoform X2 n=1 Tax=Mercenaria mercenaria TaxID=6596 RepID=UPI00234E4AAE|nr:tubulin-specific chaperone cofactor E-like protein isoform X2 [Mercenaria mercenaria]